MIPSVLSLSHRHELPPYEAQFSQHPELPHHVRGPPCDTKQALPPHAGPFGRLAIHSPLTLSACSSRTVSLRAIQQGSVRKKSFPEKPLVLQYSTMLLAIKKKCGRRVRTGWPARPGPLSSLKTRMAPLLSPFSVGMGPFGSFGSGYVSQNSRFYHVLSVSVVPLVSVESVIESVTW